MLKPLQIAKERGWELGGDGGSFFDFGAPIVVGIDIKGSCSHNQWELFKLVVWFHKTCMDIIIGTSFRPDFTSKLVHVLAFGKPKFYIAPYDKIKHELVNLSSNCDMKSGLRAD